MERKGVVEKGRREEVAEKGEEKERAKEDEGGVEEGEEGVKEEEEEEERDEEGEKEERDEEGEEERDEEGEEEEENKEWYICYQNVGGGIETINILLEKGRQEKKDFIFTAEAWGRKKGERITQQGYRTFSKPGS